MMPTLFATGKTGITYVQIQGLAYDRIHCNLNKNDAAETAYWKDVHNALLSEKVIKKNKALCHFSNISYKG